MGNQKERVEIREIILTLENFNNTIKDVIINSTQIKYIK